MEMQRNCPYCEMSGKSKDTKKHLYINTKKGVAYCHRCNYKGRWEDTLTFPEIYIPKPKFTDIDIFSFKVKGGEEVLDYMYKRLPETIVMERVRWSPQLKGRAILPIAKDTWQARAIYPNVKPKYLSRGTLVEYVYNIENVKDYVVICEGQINALSTPHGVAVFNKHISDTQLMLLTSKFNHAIIAFDYGAEKDAKKAKEQLAKYMKVDILKFEDERDCNDLGLEVMKRRIYGYNKNT